MFKYLGLSLVFLALVSGVVATFGSLPPSDQLKDTPLAVIERSSSRLSETIHQDLKLIGVESTSSMRFDSETKADGCTVTEVTILITCNK